jgi:short-subunit dehydrogenase
LAEGIRKIMPKKISESVIVVTGASSGIGRATALEIARQKGTVVLASRQSEALNELCVECESLGGRALPVPTDVADEVQVQQLAKRAFAAFGRIDAWVNCAAVAAYAKFEDIPAETFRQVIETNLFGCVHGARAVLPYFYEQGEGVLINISSAFGKVGAPYASPYTASKFAVAGFSESLRMELRDQPRIHVCTILPATMDTPIFQHAANYTGRFLEALPPVYKPEEAVETILGCVLEPKREVLVGRAAKQVVMLRKISGALTERIMSAKVEKQHFQERSWPASPGNVFTPMHEYNTVSGGWRDTDHNAKKFIAAVSALLLAGAAVAFYRYRSRKRLSLTGVRERLDAVIAQ